MNPILNLSPWAAILFCITAYSAPTSQTCQELYRAVAASTADIVTRQQQLIAQSGECRGSGEFEYRLAKLYSHNRDYVMAEAIINDGLRIDGPWRPYLLISQGDLFLMKRNYASAKQFYQKFIKSKPKSHIGYGKVGMTLLKQQKWRKASRYLLKAASIKATPLAYQSLTIAYNQLGEHANTIKVIDVALSLDRKTAAERDVMLAATDSYLALNKLELAQMTMALLLKWQPSLKDDPDTSDLLEKIDARITLNRANLETRTDPQF